MEVASKENNEVNSGVVLVAWHKYTTIWNYDRQAFDRLVYFEKSCFPVQCIAQHICRPSSVVMELLKPVTAVFTDKRARVRTVFHDVPEDEPLNALSEYGILKDMLPTEMGGTLQLDLRMQEWMDTRRAVEMEEI